MTPTKYTTKKQAIILTVKTGGLPACTYDKFVGKPIQAPPQIYSAFHFLRNAITPIQANIASPAANGR